MTDYEQAAVNIITLYRTFQEQMESVPGLQSQWATLEFVKKKDFSYCAWAIRWQGRTTSDVPLGFIQHYSERELIALRVDMEHLAFRLAERVKWSITALLNESKARLELGTQEEPCRT